MKTIRSLKNPLIKEVLSLQAKKREREKTGLFVLEGLRELGIALESGYQLDTLFYSPDYMSLARIEFELPQLRESTPFTWVDLDRHIFERLAYRAEASSVLALCKLGKHDFSVLPQKEQPFYLLLEGIEKPGNLGAMLRTADAAGLDGVIIADPLVDLYNPNVIRSSLGCVCSLPIAMGSSEACLDFLRERKLQIWVSDLHIAENYHRCDFQPGAALVLGTEATGISDFWRDASDLRIKIPMLGRIDSMNVSNAAAILMYEIQKQRGRFDGL